MIRWLALYAAGWALFLGILLGIAVQAGAETCGAPVAVPQTVTAGHSTYYSDGLPPERFRRNRKFTLQFGDQNQIDGFCGKAPCNMVTLGCQSDTAHLILLPNPCKYAAHGDGYATLLCHELGHLNGWPATHGD